MEMYMRVTFSSKEYIFFLEGDPLDALDLGKRFDVGF